MWQWPLPHAKKSKTRGLTKFLGVARCHTLLPQKKPLEFRWNFVQCLTNNCYCNESFNEIPTKLQRNISCGKTWCHTWPNQIPTIRFLSQNWLYPIYCTWRIIMVEPHIKGLCFTWGLGDPMDKSSWQATKAAVCGTVQSPWSQVGCKCGPWASNGGR